MSKPFLSFDLASLSEQGQIRYHHTNVNTICMIFMGTSRTAISLNTELLKQTDKIAQETGNSRSGVIAIALNKYFQELEQERISATLDEIYGDDSNSELNLTKAGTQYFGDRVLENEEW